MSEKLHPGEALTIPICITLNGVARNLDTSPDVLTGRLWRARPRSVIASLADTTDIVRRDQSVQPGFADVTVSAAMSALMTVDVGYQLTVQVEDASGAKVIAIEPVSILAVWPPVS